MTRPDPAALIIAHLSDLHLGADDPAAVRSVAADVAAAGPALTVVTGDFTMRARVSEFRAARALLDRLPAPLLVVTGNHDLPLVSLARLIRPYARYRRWIEPELDPVVRLPGLVALGLQSMPRWRWKSGRVSRRQSDRVEAVLGTAPAGWVRLVAMHHPPWSAGLARVIGRAGLFRALATARVDLLLAGHTHVPTSRSVAVPGASHPLVEVVAGTTTSRRTRDDVGRSWTMIGIGADVVCVRERYQSASTGWVNGGETRYPRSG
jgi:3',5'-cyclic AMP phosphodiesterase CpdA